MTRASADTRPEPGSTPAPDVCLVSMPYAALSTPSLALGLLKAILADEGITATVAPANLWFAEFTGLPLYEVCASRVPIVYLSGEWTFAGAAFADDPRRAAKDEEYLRQVTAAVGRSVLGGKSDRSSLAADLMALRAAATEFVDLAARRVLATGARVVGCTSTFEQHVASLALLRRIHELDPDVITVLGGANCETVMGEATHRCFKWVDYVVSGEADGIVGDLFRLALTKGRGVTPDELPVGVFGPCHRGEAAGRPTLLNRPTPTRALFNALDSLPAPDYSDYFSSLAESPLCDHVRPGIPMESSRGCWWGAVHQCTFCGLNGMGLAFRSKSPDRVLAEMQELEDRYGISDFEMVDNILDMGYFTSLLPRLAAADRPRRIFYEIKANITRTQVESLVESGVRWVQPGIESLHSEVLQLMDKGVKGWQNVQLLKWSQEYGLRMSWSILWGFPGEKDDWYEEMAGWIPALEHLSPPSGVPRMRYDRYSVYHEQARKRGLLLFPLGTMSYVYPVYPADLERLAYFFATEPSTGPLRYAESTATELAKYPGIAAVATAVRDWREAYRGRRPVLWMADRNGELVITDTRRCAASRLQVFRGLDRAVLLACDRTPRPGRLGEIVRSEFGIVASDDEVAACVDRLVSARLVLLMDDRLLGLALTSVPLPQPTIAEFPGGQVTAGRATVPAESR